MCTAQEVEMRALRWQRSDIIAVIGVVVAAVGSVAAVIAIPELHDVIFGHVETPPHSKAEGRIRLAAWPLPTSEDGLSAMRHHAQTPDVLNQHNGLQLFSGSDWSFAVSKWGQCDYSLLVDGEVSFKNTTFNQPGYLRSLGDISILRMPGLDRTAGSGPYRPPTECENGDVPIKWYSELWPDILHFRLFLKFKNKPRESDEIEFSTGPRRWVVQAGALDWTEVHSVPLVENGRLLNSGEKSVWWGAGAKLQLSTDDPDWVVVRSARVLPVKRDRQNSQDALLEVTIENRSMAPAPVEGLNLTAVGRRGGGCQTGPGYQAPPPIQVTINWPKVVQLSKFGPPRDQVLVTLADTVVSAEATYTRASCISSETFITQIPVQITIPSLQIGSVTLHIKEPTVKTNSSEPPLPFLEWENVAIGIKPNDFAFPRQYAIRGTLPLPGILSDPGQ
jgi:hypothetical protein